LIHPTAIVEPGVEIGDGTTVWDSVHIRGPSRIGANCIIGEKTYIAYGVSIGNLVKINAFVYICAGVSIEDGVMLSAGTTFTNDRYPRATDPEVSALRPSEPDVHSLETIVRKGATIGAQAVIGPGLEIGEFAMIGMGSVVTRSVPPYVLTVGNPAKPIAAVCECGQSIDKLPSRMAEATCSTCGRSYRISGISVERIRTGDD
jgi:acetyltransferase-like isoleucine patch superfamily enzyme